MSTNPEPRMTREEAFDAAIVALKAQGLTPSEFGLAIRDRMIRGELDATEALKQIEEYHTSHARIPAVH